METHDPHPKIWGSRPQPHRIDAYDLSIYMSIYLVQQYLANLKM